MQVVLSLRVGGLERVVVDLVQNASEEFRLIVCCLEEPGAWGGEVPHVVALGNTVPGLDWRLFWKIARLARSEKVDVIHTHNSAAHLYGAIGGKLAGVKVLHTEHGKNLGDEARVVSTEPLGRTLHRSHRRLYRRQLAVRLVIVKAFLPSVSRLSPMASASSASICHGIRPVGVWERLAGLCARKIIRCSCAPLHGNSQRRTRLRRRWPVARRIGT
jgi:hypothetical protein